MLYALPGTSRLTEHSKNSYPRQKAPKTQQNDKRTEGRRSKRRTFKQLNSNRQL